MDPQLVVLTETLGAGIEQHKASAQFYREKGEGFAAAQADNKQKTDAAVTNLETQISLAMQNIGSGNFTYRVSHDGDDETADGTLALPFSTIEKAISTVPAGMKASINLLGNAGDVFLISNDFQLNGREITIYGSVAGKGISVAFLSSERVEDQARIGRGIQGSGLLNFVNCVVLGEADTVDTESTNIQSGCIENTHNSLSIRFWDCDVGCSRLPLLDGSHSGILTVSMINSTMYKAEENGALFKPSWNSKIEVYTAGSFSCEGDLSDYFKSTVRESVVWNQTPIQGTL